MTTHHLYVGSELCSNTSYNILISHRTKSQILFAKYAVRGPSVRPTGERLSIRKTMGSCLMMMVWYVVILRLQWIPVAISPALWLNQQSADWGASPGWCSTSSCLFNLLVSWSHFYTKFLSIYNGRKPTSSLPTTTCLWFQGLTVFVIDIKLKENTNPSPTDQQGHSVRISINTDQTYYTPLRGIYMARPDREAEKLQSLSGWWLAEGDTISNWFRGEPSRCGRADEWLEVHHGQSVPVSPLSLSLSLSREGKTNERCVTSWWSSHLQPGITLSPPSYLTAKFALNIDNNINIHWQLAIIRLDNVQYLVLPLHAYVNIDTQQKRPTKNLIY